MEYVAYEGLRLPPRELVTRHGGKSDAHHVRSARQIVQRLIDHADLTADDRVLDIGCGGGRFLIGMQSIFGSFRSYTGLDVRKPVIEWAQRNLTTENISFHWLDLENPRYNRRGKPLEGKVLPIDDGSADVLALFSVFSHMTLEDIALYLREFRRVMSNDGRAYCTAFVEDDVPEWEENPADYIREWAGPLHCVRLNRETFEGLVEAAELRIDRFLYQHEQGRQSAFVLRHHV